MSEPPSATDRIGADFWAWRAAQQPCTSDDIVRIVRPKGWRPEWAPDAITGYGAALGQHERALAALPEPADTAEHVDRMLLRSAMARVHWELDVLRSWQRNPGFYVDQTLGALFELLTPPQVDRARLLDVTRILKHIGPTLEAARHNLDGLAAAEPAARAVEGLGTVVNDVGAVVRALAGIRPSGWTADDDRTLDAAGRQAASALAEFRTWLAAQVPALPPAQPVGRDAFQWFLAHVALVPLTPEELLELGRREFDRAASLELLARNRAANADEKPAYEIHTIDDLIAAEERAARDVRSHYARNRLLSEPNGLRRYLYAPLPDHLRPIQALGVTDDLTGPDRLDQDAVSYVTPPRDDLPYFAAASALDPRLGIVHEGAHYEQLARSWRHPRPIRRHYYDSAANEGIAFYNEELAATSGLFDTSPRAGATIYNFMRLRALRVEVDVQLAVGDLDVVAATARLRDDVPLDEPTARAEATFFATAPGQASSYQIGKSQILSLLADAAQQAGSEFDLRGFHDRLWLEGNVPLALQRLELLGDDTDLRRVADLS